MDQPENSVEDLRNEASKTLGELKGRGIMGFFSFDHFIFPSVARVLFILWCILTALIFAVMAIGALVSLLGGQIGPALGLMVGSVIYSLILLVTGRMGIELGLVAFKINDSLADIKELLKKR